MAAVSFSYPLWIARYPEFSGVNPTLAAAYWSEAALYCDNTDCSPITDDSVGGQRNMLLNMLTAHIAQLNAALNGQAASPLVGRINSATEGSVTVQAENQYAPGTVQWFQQTKYGSAFWAATAQYRTMRYVPGPRRVMDPWRRGY